MSKVSKDIQPDNNTVEADDQQAKHRDLEEVVNSETVLLRRFADGQLSDDKGGP